MAAPKMSPKGQKIRANTNAASAARSNTGTAGGASLFLALRKVFRAHEAALTVAKDGVGEYELTTKGTSGKPSFFGGVRTFRSHTAFYLAPLASETEVAGTISELLKKRMEGPSTFHFKTIEPTLIEELATLTEKALEHWRAAGKLGTG